jgi:hypothetical protein
MLINLYVLNFKTIILTLNPNPLYHQCDQFGIMFIFIYVTSCNKVNKSFWKHEFHDVLEGNQIFKKYLYVSWLMNYHNMIWVLHLNKSGLGNIEL